MALARLGRSKALWAVLLALVVVAAAVAVGPFITRPEPVGANFATNNGNVGCEGVNVADNHTHVLSYNNLEDAMRNASNWNRANNLNPTDINTSLLTGPPAPATDVIANDANYTGTTCGSTWCDATPCTPTSVVGYALCWSINVANECEQHRVFFDTGYINQPGVGLGLERYLACHEYGHTIGLTHTGSPSCMQSGSSFTLFTAHDVCHINNWYDEQNHPSCL